MWLGVCMMLCWGESVVERENERERDREKMRERYRVYTYVTDENEQFVVHVAVIKIGR